MEQNTTYRPFVPMLMLAVSVAVWMGFSTMQLMQERDALQATGEKQQMLVDQSTKVRKQLGAIGEQLAKLHQQGNRGATEIVEQMEKNGIKMGLKSKTDTDTDSNAVPPE